MQNWVDTQFTDNKTHSTLKKKKLNVIGNHGRKLRESCFRTSELKKKCFGQDLRSIENKSKNKLYIELETLHTARETIIGVKR